LSSSLGDLGNGEERIVKCEKITIDCL
jgi:hypothetical protein